MKVFVYNENGMMCADSENRFDIGGIPWLPENIAVFEKKKPRI